MPKQKKTNIDLGKGKNIKIPVNYQHFILDYSSNLEMDADLMNSIGTFFEDGVCVKPDINAAVFWYEQAIEFGNDLARSNLADILRKGCQGYPKDLRRAFELYKECGLPYAHYRVGEFYEHGWGTEKDLEKAKTYYTLAYKEGHGLARKKLKDWNFLE